MGLLNCWNWKNCGRYPGGSKADELGVCPAALDTKSDGFLQGRNGGRGCIYITGTLCGGNKQGNFEEKHKNCMKCDYYIALKKIFKLQISSIRFNNYYKQTDSDKEKTDKNQKWVSENVSGEKTSENAKKRYKN